MQMRLSMAVVWLACGTSMLALGATPDQIRNAEGTMLGSGRVTVITPTKVVVEATGGTKEVSVNDIAQITYEGEPGTLKTARKYITEKNYEEALDTLDKVQLAGGARKEVSADVDFYKALASGKLVQRGSGDPVEAGRMLVAFCTAHQNSYHYYDAVELLGDLLLIARRPDSAAEYYTRLAQAPWPNRKLRAAVAMGRVYLMQNKIAEAAKAFTDAAAINAPGEEGDTLRAEAALGKLRCQAEAGKGDEALAQVEALIAKTDPEQVNLLAQAYNIRGLIHRKAGKDKEALMDYLHVDVLYSANADAHAESLAALAELFAKAQQSERASRAKQMLLENYPNSPWIKK